MNGDFPQTYSAEPDETSYPHSNMDELITMSELESLKNGSGGLMDWVRQLAYNIASRSQGFPSQPISAGSIGGLIKSAITPVAEDEPVYTGGISPSYDEAGERIYQDPDLLGFFLKRKTMEQAGLEKQYKRPTKVSERYKNLPTASIKEYTKVVPVSDTYRWSDKILQKLKNLEKGEVIKFSEEDRIVGNIGIYPQVNLGSYTLSAGRDDQGAYISLFDVWDFGKGYAGKYLGEQSILEQIQAPLMQAAGQPFAIYDRYYISDTELQVELDRRRNER